MTEMISGVAYEPLIPEAYLILLATNFCMDLWHTIIDEIRRCSAAIEVVDARCPNETRSLKLEKILGEMKKPFWIVINKADLVPKHFLERAKELIKAKSEATDVVYVSTRKYHGFNILKRSLKEGLGKETESRLVVVGFPNVGKSSLINMLSRRGKVGVSPRPGFTRGKQWIRISRNLLVSDTPGVLDLSDAAVMWRKVLFPKKDLEGAAIILLRKIKDADGNNFSRLYGIEIEDDCQLTLQNLATRFSFLMKGGKLDVSRAAKRLIDDWNNGRLVAWWL